MYKSRQDKILCRHFTTIICARCSCVFNMENNIENVDNNNISNNEDTLTNAIGRFGRWHIILLIVLMVPTKMSAIWTQLAIMIMAPKTSFRCVERANVTQDAVIVNSTCYSDCIKYEYSSQFDNTIISEWNLICERKWLVILTQTVCMFGILVGSVIFGFFADRYGRRAALLSSCMLQLICSFAVPFAPNFWVFTTIRFFLGTATAGIMIAPFTLILELTGPGKRELVTSFINLPLALGEIVMPLFAYYLRSWNTFSLGLAVPNLLFLTYFFLVPESPKWLISTGKLDKASEIMSKVAKSNRLPPLNMIDVAKRISDEASSNRPVVKTTYLDLIKRPSIRMKNACSCLSWFILGLSFYGSNQYIGQTSPQVFLTIAFAGILQIPGICVSLFCCKRFGRRTTIISFLTICAISNGLLALPDDWFYVKLVVGSMGVCTAAGAFAAMYMYTTELFPTVVRNMALGTSSMSSRIGSMLAPFVVGLGSVAPWMPPAVFGLVPLVAAAACYCLPETKGVKMTDFLED